jgi:hypothetical protein
VTCECYPPEKYPAYLRKGCVGIGSCWVLAEARACRTPEGRAAEQAKYHVELKAAADRADEKPSAGDVIWRVQRMGVPATALFAVRNEKPTQILTVAKDWWASDRRTFPVLVMAGDVGTGKTTAAAWCAVEWARAYPWNKLPTGSNEAPMVWLDGPRLRELGAFGEEAANTLAAAATADLTIVDDAGREGDRRALEALSDVLTERTDKRRSTILSSNLKGKEFVARYGTALADRLRAVAVMPGIKGESMRVRGAA